MTRVVMRACNISLNSASAGGGLYAQAGSILLSNGTSFKHNIASHGATLLIQIAVAVYQLPAPSGHFISASVCEAVFIGCPVGCGGSCGDGNLSLSPLQTAEPNNCGARAPFAIQPCPWNDKIDPSALGIGILGQWLQYVPSGALDLPQWPTPCLPGIQGAEEDYPQGQSTSMCAGLCSAGYYCPSDATVNATICPPGHFCPTGSALPRPCPGGTFSSAKALGSQEECTDAEPGHFAPTGSVEPTPCAPGTYSSRPGLRSCLRCDQGSFQPAENATACKDCPPASFCDAKGMAAPKLCPAGGPTYSTRREDMTWLGVSSARRNLQQCHRPNL